MTKDTLRPAPSAVPRSPCLRWAIVVLYAIAMAWVESAVVFYLRTITGQMVPYPPTPSLIPDSLVRAEAVREFSTMVMLFAVGWLAGQTWRSRLAFGIIAFGVWDIFYYVFLLVLTGWPSSPLDWDILFLLPLPWWGPVLAPVLIATLMILGGTMVSQFDRAEQPLWPGSFTIALNVAGSVLALYVFMSDALAVAGQGLQALRNLVPVVFNWPLFLVALVLMAAPVVELGIQARKRVHAAATANTGGHGL